MFEEEIMKTTLITGAGRGIGLALTKEFLANGYKVIGTFRDESKANELITLAKENSNLIPITADVTDENSFSTLKKLLDKETQLDYLINNSGVIGSRSDSILELKIEQLIDVFKVNTFGPMLICQLAIPYLKSKGTVAHITSMMGSISDNASGGYYDYRMSKTALNMFNKCLSLEYPSLTCLLLHPGWVQTEMGGQGAQVTPGESAKGLFKVITEAKLNQSGGFLDFRGKTIPW